MFESRQSKTAIFTLLGVLIFSTITAMFFWCLEQPYAYSGFRISSSSFEVMELYGDSPAERGGFEIGDVIVRMNDIDAVAFAENYYNKTNYIWYKEYSRLFSKGKVYECVLTDGTIRFIVIPNKLTFLEKIRFLSIDDKVGYTTGAVFIITGILLSLFGIGLGGVPEFVIFLYSSGLCLCNAYSDTHNLLAFSICNLVLFHLSSAGAMFGTFRMLSHFYEIIGGHGHVKRLNFISIIPLVLFAARMVLSAGNPQFFHDGWMFYLPYVNLICLLYAMITLVVIMRRIPRQSSLFLRFFLIGTSFGVAPAIFQLFIRLFFSSLGVIQNGESLYTYLPLLFIPVSVFCAFLQTQSIKVDSAVSHVMVLGCSIISTVILQGVPLKGDGWTVFMLLFVPFFYMIYEKPITSLLYPQFEYLQNSFDGLEKKVFACNDEDEIFTYISDWLSKMINPSFVVFYEMGDKTKGRPGRILYERIFRDEGYHSSLNAMIESRLDNPKNNGRVMISNDNGFSAPVYKAHQVIGFAFIGNRSRYESFTGKEIRLMVPISRILMESLLVMDLKKQVEYVNNMQNRIIYSFADMIESRDGTTGQHVKRTSRIVELLAGLLQKDGTYGTGFSEEDYSLVALAAPLHDIGKIKVPDRILSKPGKLTPEEFEIIKTHSAEGEKIIRKTMMKIENERYLTIAREMALHHHERWNGTGYPEGLSGAQIPISARIMAVADVFDALCSSRSYKKAFTMDETFRILDESRNTHFESVLVDAMHRLRPELEEMYSSSDE